MDLPNKKAACILFAIAVPESMWVYFNMAGHVERFWRWTGFFDLRRAGWLGWILALLCALLYIWVAARLPSVRENLVRLSFLKLLAVLVAFAAGFCEEAIFRKWLMDALQHRELPVAVQVVTSAFLFGATHSVWGLFRGSWRTAAGAMVATGVLGLALAVVYVASQRVLAPCVVAHFLINLFIEPGLVLAAVRGEMGHGHAQRRVA